MQRWFQLVSFAVGGVAAIAVAGCSAGGACDPTAPGTICTIAGSGPNSYGGGYGGDGGRAVNAVLAIPTDVAVGPNGDVWISDFNNYRIRAIDKDGIIRTVAGTGVIGDDPPPGEQSTPALETAFNHATDIAFTPDRKYLYMAAWQNSRIKRLDLATMTIENVAGTGHRGAYTGDGGPAIDANLDLPCGVTAGPQGNVTFIDQANQVIRSVDQDGIIHRVAGQCVIDWPCPAGQKPQACPGSDKLTCGDPATTCDQICAPGYSGDGGQATDLHMDQPFGQDAFPAGRTAYDAQGDLFFTDPGNNRIREITTGGLVYTVAGTGTAGYSGDGGSATDAELNHPIDLSVTADGSIYFTDTRNNCIRKVDPSGVISTVAGQCNPNMTPDLYLANHTSGFAGDGGDPTQALLNWPFGLDVVGHKLYIADTYNNRIRVVNL